MKLLLIKNVHLNRKDIIIDRLNYLAFKCIIVLLLELNIHAKFKQDMMTLLLVLELLLSLMLLLLTYLPCVLEVMLMAVQLILCEF